VGFDLCLNFEGDRRISLAKKFLSSSDIKTQCYHTNPVIVIIGGNITLINAGGTFAQVVIGISDVNAATLSGDSSTSISPKSINVLGVDMPEADNPTGQSRYLYHLVAQLFGK